MLTHLDISDYLSCERTSVDLTSRLTALVGCNGVGKTNILRAIQTIANTQSKVNALEALAHESPAFSLETRIEADVFQYKMAICPDPTQVADSKRVLHEKLVRTDANLKTQTVFSRENKFLTVSRGKYQTTFPIMPFTPSALVLPMLPDPNPELNAVKQYLAFWKNTGYYTLESHVEDDFLDDEDYKTLKESYETQGTLPASCMFRLVYLHNERPDTYNEFCELIGQNGLRLISEAAIRTLSSFHSDDIRTMTKNETNKKLWYASYGPYEGLGGSQSIFLFSQLSAGTRRIIRLLASMLLDRRQMMLIEQPEDSIHPAMLQRVIDILRSYSDQTQFVLTTHSPAVLNMLEPDNLILVSAPEGNTLTRRLSESEITAAELFLQKEGTLSEYFELLEEKQ